MAEFRLLFFECRNQFSKQIFIFHVLYAYTIYFVNTYHKHQSMGVWVIDKSLVIECVAFIVHICFCFSSLMNFPAVKFLGWND